MYKIALHLRDTGKVSPLMHRTWKLHQDGFTFFAIRAMLRQEAIEALEQRPPSDSNLRNEVMPKTFDPDDIRGVSARTLNRWFDRVQLKIERVQDEQKEGRALIGLTLDRNGEVEFVVDTVVREVLRSVF